MSENCKSLVLQDKCNIEIFLSPDIVMYIMTNSNLFLVIHDICTFIGYIANNMDPADQEHSLCLLQ